MSCTLLEPVGRARLDVELATKSGHEKRIWTQSQSADTYLIVESDSSPSQLTQAHPQEDFLFLAHLSLPLDFRLLLKVIFTKSLKKKYLSIPHQVVLKLFLGKGLFQAVRSKGKEE